MIRSVTVSKVLMGFLQVLRHLSPGCLSAGIGLQSYRAWVKADGGEHGASIRRVSGSSLLSWGKACSLRLQCFCDRTGSQDAA